MKRIIAYVKKTPSFSGNISTLATINPDKTIKVNWDNLSLVVVTNFPCSYGVPTTEVKSADFVAYFNNQNLTKTMVALFDTNLAVNDFYWFHDFTGRSKNGEELLSSGIINTVNYQINLPPKWANLFK